jgi:hypothetical protein
VSYRESPLLLLLLLLPQQCCCKGCAGSTPAGSVLHWLRKLHHPRLTITQTIASAHVYSVEKLYPASRQTQTTTHARQRPQ